MKSKTICAVAAVITMQVMGVSAWADSKTAVQFMHKDWSLHCDNTRTCRAAGYQAEGGNSDPVSIQLTRAAGAGTAVEISLLVSSETPFTGPLQLKLGQVLAQGLNADKALLSTRQVQLVLPQLLINEEALVLAQGKQWKLSLAGATAVLLKMDEAQGRVGTRGALVRPGSRSEANVLPPLAAPQIKAVLPLAAQALDSKAFKPVFAQIRDSALAEDCKPWGGPLTEPMVYRLSPGKILLSLTCPSGAYNEIGLLWIANEKPPFNPELLKVAGEFDPADGSVNAVHKGRGIADCLSYKTWHFDGAAFVLTAESGDSMCRGFVGGAWNPPIFVSQLTKPASALQKKNLK